MEIRDIQEKLKTLCARVDNLENLKSTNSINNNGELQVVTTEQPSDVENTQEQQVTVFLVSCFFLTLIRRSWILRIQCIFGMDF